ncbi:MAG: DegT/DnrJ/EryC1/StrS family aminotransferase [Candidatus Azobacteroides sp.]|nr:DegT/DnrJ/EryC1/StrS family aminotransferase [Candidatus Azobacteroides sp.]
MDFYNQFVINPEKFRIPQYSISPFSTEWVRKNYKILQSKQPIDNDLLRQYFGRFLCFETGRSALSYALSHYKLSENDEVCIMTTSQNRYISSCVTKEIEKFCQWSRQLSEKTKVILVNHEFGTAYKSMDKVLKLNLPIIEDLAMSLFSTDDNQQTGNYGDFTIYSLPKFFPLQWGGIVKINMPDYEKKSINFNPHLSTDLQRLLSFYLKEGENIKQRRKHHNALFQHYLSCLDFKSRFEYNDNETPSVYMCSTPPSVNLEGLKVFLQQNGVEASVFYGESAFFVPVHQNLNEEDILFIVSLIKYFCDDNK